MGLFDKIRGPVFWKESSTATVQLEQLQKRLETAIEELRPKIEQEIKMVQAGIHGENQILFELKNSHIPMIVLHDLFLEHEGLSAQIDYLIITRKHIFVVESKNLIGNIEINSSGDFIRTIQWGKKFQKEGLYSPITQNKRHLELIRAIRRDEKSNFVARALFDRSFDETYRSIVVLANPKTYLNARFARKEIKQQVIRADQLSEYIRKTDAEDSSGVISEQVMMELAQFFLDRHKENPRDYTERFQCILKQPEAEEENGEKAKQEEQIRCPRCGAPMVKRTAKKGENAGQEFYGCSRFPQCRGIINIV